ncbi:MAG: lipoyl(octanoyl) transferase LipB [Nitrospira defluvii]|nr:lipoyl(octanoyl) transferase LipB [Nitrospira defluvii]
MPSRQPERTEAPQTGTLVLCERLPYEAAWSLQRTCRAERAAGRCRDLLLLMEHSPVFTAGRTTQDRHWPGEEQLTRQTDIPVIRTERGGSITYHGPGQTIGYPILRLSDYCAGPKAYVHRLEEVLITTLSEWGIVGHRRERLPGVWVGGGSPSKIAFIGVRISQGITTHGFALNVAMDLTPFSHIVPCGIADCRVTSMSALMGTAPDMHVVQQRIAATFAERFHLTWTQTIGPENMVSLMEPPTVPLVTSPINAQFSHEE